MNASEPVRITDSEPRARESEPVHISEHESRTRESEQVHIREHESRARESDPVHIGEHEARTRESDPVRMQEPEPDTVARAVRPAWAMYVWVLVVLAVAVMAIVLGWHARGGTPDPTVPGNHMSRTSAVIDSAVLVFREGLETILVLAAVMASFLGSNRAYRKPVAVGGGIAFGAAVATWFVVVWLIGMLGHGGLSLQAATGIPAIVVLLIVMNWFFHRVYWTGWISHHHKRRRRLLDRAGVDPVRATMIGLLVLGFSSVYREGFEIVIFLQGLRETFGSSVVLEGTLLGLLFTAAVGVLTFGLHQRLPYKRLLIITGALLVVVLWVMVGEEVNEMQLAGWIGTTNIPGLTIPGWLGTWLSIFPNVETIAAQLIAVTVVLGSYLAAQYLRVWRPRRLGLRPARIAEQPPTQPARPSTQPAVPLANSVG